MDTMEIFNDVVGKVNDDAFWSWVGTWKDPQDIIETAQYWDEKEVLEEIEKLRNLDGAKLLTKKQLKDLQIVDDILYALNSHISMRWIGLKEKPSEKDILQMNKNIGEAIKMLRAVYE